MCKFEERKEKGKEQRHLKIAELKDRMLKNQEDWSISSKKPEYQQPVLVTSGVLIRLHYVFYMY